MFKDEQRDTVWSEIRQHDLRSFSGELTPDVFVEAASKAGVRVVESPLNLVNLVWLGISAAIHHALNFASVLTITLKLLEDQETFYATNVGKSKRKGQRQERRKKKGKSCRGKSKHDPRRADPTQLTEEAFSQARQKMPLAFWTALILVLAERFQKAHGQHSRTNGFRLLALDGTTWTLENWLALRDYYGTPKNGSRQRKPPQARMVMLMLPTVRIPLVYEVTPLSNSEQTVAARLLNHLQINDLVLMDRGFFSYGLFWQIQNRQAFFGIRLKKGMNFRTLKRLGCKDRLVEWQPKDSRGKWKAQRLPRTMRLRVIDYQVSGFRPSAIVTNVLDPKKISREDWVRLAVDCHKEGKLKPGLYHRRWEIETTYFELKVRANAKFRSRTPASLEYEIAGRLLYYLLVRWLIVKAAEKHGQEPLRLSFSGAIQELEQMRPSLITSSPEWVERVLFPRLLDRIAQHVVPLRPGRHYPRPNDTKPKDMGKGQVRLPAKLTSTKTKPRKSNRRKSNRRNAKQTLTSQA
jgi:hypothetical protein